MPLTIRPLSAADLTQGLAFAQQSGWNQTLVDWRRTLALVGDGLLGGWEGERLVATGSLFTYPAGPSWIGMILVDETHRRRGFGRQMMQAVLARARQQSGDAVGLDASDYGRPLYRSLGFHDVAPIARWQGTLAPSSASRDDSLSPHVAVLPAGELSAAALAELLAWDRAATGCDRSELLGALAAQPEVRIYRATSDEALSFRGKGQPLLGYGLVREGRLAWHLGPLVATSAAAGSAVIDAVAQDLAGEPLACDLFDRPEAAAALSQVGLSAVRQLTRMTLDRPQPWLMGPAVWAATSFEYG